ncbi:major facilitator superfamily domain-containing protein, partial [Globomyces pollinis-pini]
KDETTDEKQFTTSTNEVNVQLNRLEFVSLIISLMMAAFLIALDITIVSTALPDIADEFDAIKYISWVGTSYMLTVTAIAPSYGSFCNIFGRKQTYLAAVFLFEFGSLICALSPSLIWLIVGRVISGFGGGGVLTVILIIVSDIVPFRSISKYQGFIVSIVALASIVGPLFGGFFVDYLSWRWCFWINVPFGVFTFVLSLHVLKYSPDEESLQSKMNRIDYIGILLIIAASICFLIPVQFGGSDWAWDSVQTIGTLIGSVVLTLILVFYERNIAKHPVIPSKMFENTTVYIVLVIGFLSGVTYITPTFYIPTFFQIVNGKSATQSGLLSIPLVVGLLTFNVGSGHLIARYGNYKYLFFIGPVIVICGEYLLSTMDVSSSSLIQSVYLLITGIGFGCYISQRTFAIQSSVSKENLAVATSMVNFVHFLGGTIGIAIGGAVFNNSLKIKL